MHKCLKCALHGSTVPLKNHKRVCPYFCCECEKCASVSRYRENINRKRRAEVFDFPIRRPWMCKNPNFAADEREKQAEAMRRSTRSPQRTGTACTSTSSTSPSSSSSFASLTSTNPSASPATASVSPARLDHWSWSPASCSPSLASGSAGLGPGAQPAGALLDPEQLQQQQLGQLLNQQLGLLPGCLWTNPNNCLLDAPILDMPDVKPELQQIPAQDSQALTLSMLLGNGVLAQLAAAQPPAGCSTPQKPSPQTAETAMLLNSFPPTLPTAFVASAAALPNCAAFPPNLSPCLSAAQSPALVGAAELNALPSSAAAAPATAAPTLTLATTNAPLLNTINLAACAQPASSCPSSWDTCSGLNEVGTGALASLPLPLLAGLDLDTLHRLLSVAAMGADKSTLVHSASCSPPAGGVKPEQLPEQQPFGFLTGQPPLSSSPVCLMRPTAQLFMPTPSFGLANLTC